jgi:hypothetical protein
MTNELSKRKFYLIRSLTGSHYSGPKIGFSTLDNARRYFHPDTATRDAKYLSDVRRVSCLVIEVLGKEEDNV